mmetsp:Transcript_8477/g.15034  ORF Transcript_8477/g.15034 Transcript_8477/m.15034 type:complete len:224 (+) Transcript_8477:1232-1903(+)
MPCMVLALPCLLRLLHQRAAVVAEELQQHLRQPMFLSSSNHRPCQRVRVRVRFHFLRRWSTYPSEQAKNSPHKFCRPLEEVSRKPQLLMLSSHLTGACVVAGLWAVRRDTARQPFPLGPVWDVQALRPASRTPWPLRCQQLCKACWALPCSELVKHRRNNRHNNSSNSNSRLQNCNSRCRVYNASCSNYRSHSRNLHLPFSWQTKLLKTSDHWCTNSGELAVP